MGATGGSWLLLIVSILLTLFVAEVAVRLSGAVEMQPRFQCFDAVIGKVYCESTEGLFSRAGYSSYLVINSDGMADREYPVTKPDGSLRIALLGDSFTASEYLPEEEKFEGLLERELSGRLGKPVEILNFGISAIETWNQLQIFHLKAVKYRPDVTLLVFFWGNDIRDNIGQLRSGSPNPLREEYDPPLMRRLRETRKNFNRALWNHSALYQLVRDRYGKLEYRLRSRFRPAYLERIDSVIASGNEGSPHGELTTIVHGMADTEFNDDDLFFWESRGWALTRKLILRLRQEVEDAGSRLVILHFPSAGLVRANIPLPHEDFDDFLERNGIPHVSLFRDYGDFDAEELQRHFIRGDGHWTPHGHRFVARQTRDLLLEALSDRLQQVQ